MDFWIDHLGFALTNEVPAADGSHVFVSAKRDGVEVMLQKRANVIAKRTDAATELDGHPVMLFVEVADLDAIERTLGNAPVVKPRHRTSDGSSELYVREPGGNVVGFAQFG